MEGIVNFLRTLLPVGTEIEWGTTVSCIGTVFSYLLGWDAVMEALIIAMVVDYLTGVLAAYINPHLALNSQKGFKGILKKMMILLLIALAHELDHAIGQQVIQTVVVWFFLGNEGLSIIENAGKAGLPIPNKLRNTLEQLASEKGDMKK